MLLEQGFIEDVLGGQGRIENTGYIIKGGSRTIPFPQEIFEIQIASGKI